MSEATERPAATDADLARDIRAGGERGATAEAALCRRLLPRVRIFLGRHLAQIHAAITYYHANRKEVEASIVAELVEAEALERQHLGIRKSA